MLRPPPLRLNPPHYLSHNSAGDFGVFLLRQGHHERGRPLVRACFAPRRFYRTLLTHTHTNTPAGDFRVFLLRQGATLVSVAAVRVFGGQFAELPYVTTREDYRRAGNFKKLMNGERGKERWRGGQWGG